MKAKVNVGAEAETETEFDVEVEVEVGGRAINWEELDKGWNLADRELK